MAAQTAGNKYQVTKMQYANQGLFYIKDVDSDNQGLFVQLRINGELVEREVDTSAVS